MHDNLFKQPNPLINENSDETLTNIQAMLARIQLLRLDLKKMKSSDEPVPSKSFCPANELHIRLLTLVKDALDHEIKKLHTAST